MKKLLLLFFFLSYQVHAQKETTNTIDAEGINNIILSADEIFKITITTAPVETITITTHSDGEYYNQISLDARVEGETLLLDASSTALEFASQLPDGMPLRVVTYSLAVVERLAAREDIELIELGGSYERRGRRFSVMLTEAALRMLRIVRFFFSGGGFDAKLGVGEPNPDQAALKRMMLEHANWSCALMDSSKLGAPTDHFFAKPDELGAMVSDKGGKTFARKHLIVTPFDLHFGR